MSLYLVGYMGSGKSSVGRRLGNRLGLEFVDMDVLIENFAKATVEDIFSSSGEETFRSLESYILEKLLQGSPKVIATGGGAPCHSNNMDRILDNGYVVYLELEPKKIAKRVQQSNKKNPGKRPLVEGKEGKDLLEFITEHMDSRRPIYERADFTVDADRVNSAMLDTIKEKYLRYIEGSQTR